jgi:AcrR family transcriptional regulator
MPRTQTDTKQRILNVTRTLYSAHGCENTTIDDIITAIGITKGAFYHYFKSKEDLCKTVIAQVIEDYQNLAQSIDQNIEPIEQLRQMIEKLSQLNTSGRWVNCRLIIRLSTDSHQSYPKIQRKIRDFWQWYSGFYEELIEKCRSAGQINTDLDSKTQTQLLMAVMTGAIMLEKLGRDKQSFTELSTTIIDMLQA